MIGSKERAEQTYGALSSAGAGWEVAGDLATLWCYLAGSSGSVKQRLGDAGLWADGRHTDGELALHTLSSAAYHRHHRPRPAVTKAGR